jgi:GT2 family glycosyltransferase
VHSGIADAADLVRKSNLPRIRILVVVVLYKMSLTDSQTIQGLLQAFARYPELHDSLSVLIWDNSPTPLKDAEPLSAFTYKHSQENLGVSGAYNRAMKIAEATGCQWLLLLDQDTAIPADFLPQILKLGCRFLNKSEIAAIVPFLVDGERILSPFKVLFKKRTPLDKPFEGVYPGEVSAANSGTLMRIDALEQIGGFNEDFWLDFSDVVAFHLLHLHGKQIYIAGDLLLKHKVAVLDFKKSMSPKRYLNFIAAEGAYWDVYGTVTERAFYTLRILERAVRQKRRFENSAYAKITLTYFFKRLFLCKKHRLRWWKLQSLQREIPTASEHL